jgi:general secretion pathway protein D
LLAGLISNEDRSNANRVPGLGDLPVLGRLFSSQKDDFQRTELVLAITPRILRSAPRPDISQAELWIGSEMATRLKAAPMRVALANADSPELIKALTIAGTTAAGMPSVASAPARTLSKTVPADAPVLASWQVPVDVKSGTDFVVTLNLSSGSPLRGVPLELSFPPQAVEVLDVTEGTFFKQSGGTASFTHSVNTSTGRIGIGTLSNDSTGVAGEGSLLQLKLRAKSAGSIDLTISSFEPIVIGGTPIIGKVPTLKLDVK